MYLQALVPGYTVGNFLFFPMLSKHYALNFIHTAFQVDPGSKFQVDPGSKKVPSPIQIFCHCFGVPFPKMLIFKTFSGIFLRKNVFSVF